MNSLNLFNWISNNLAICTLIISLVNISITLWNWNNMRPRMIFLDPDFRHFYRASYPEEYHYKDSECIVMCQIKIANRSSHPITVSSVTLSVQGYDDTTMSSHLDIRDSYLLSKSDSWTYKLPGNRILKLPCTLSQFGYLEGVLLFPYAPSYSGHVKATITLHTSRKNFKTSVMLHHQTDMEEQQLY